jgi:hypothetical protein
MNLKHRVRRLEHARKSDCPVCHGVWHRIVFRNSPFVQNPPDPCPACGHIDLHELVYESRPSPHEVAKFGLEEATRMAERRSAEERAKHGLIDISPHAWMRKREAEKQAQAAQRSR